MMIPSFPSLIAIQKLINQHRLEEAQKQLVEVLQQDPTKMLHYQGLLLQSIINRELGQEEHAQTVLAKLKLELSSPNKSLDDQQQKWFAIRISELQSELYLLLSQPEKCMQALQYAELLLSKLEGGSVEEREILQAWIDCRWVGLKWFQGNIEAALEYCTKSSTCFARYNQFAEVAFIDNMYGILYGIKGDYDHALEYYMRARQFFLSIENLDRVAVTDFNIGTIYHFKGELSQALDYYSTAHTILAKLGNDKYICIALRAIGNIQFERGCLSEALEVLNQALSIAYKREDEAEIAKGLQNIGNVYSSKGEYSKALEYLIDACQRFTKIQSKLELGLVQHSLASIYRVRGEFRLTLEYYDKARQNFESSGNLDNIGDVFSGKASCYKCYGDYGKALEMAEQALAHYQAVHNPMSIAGVLVNQAQLLYLSSQSIESANILSKFPPAPYETELMVAKKLTLEALIAQQASNWQKARELYKQALKIPGVDAEEQIELYRSICEIILKQLQKRASKQLYTELKNILSQIKTIASQNSLMTTLCEYYLLHGKLSIAITQLPEAIRDLQEGLQIAKEKGLPVHSALIDAELKKCLELNQQCSILTAENRQQLEQEQLEQFNTYLTTLYQIIKKK